MDQVRPTWLLLSTTTVVVMLVAATMTVIGISHRDPAAVMSASSHISAHGAGRAAPGVRGSWRPKGNVTGAWLQRTWTEDTELRRVIVREDPAREAGPVAGYLRFSDGSRMWVQVRDSKAAVAITPRRVTWMRFTFAHVPSNAMSLGLTELDADGDDGPHGSPATDGPRDGNVAPRSRMTGASPALVDGNTDTVARVHNHVLLRWSRPRELTRVSIAGADSGSQMSRGTLTFSDGSVVPVGGVTADVMRPTVVAFMARTTTRVLLTVDSLSGPGDLHLSELAAYQLGSPPARPVGGAESPDTQVQDDPPCVPSGPRPSNRTGLVVLCPTNGATVHKLARVFVAAGTSYARVTAVPWGDGVGVGAASPARAVLNVLGRGVLDVDVSRVAPGPFVVAITARGKRGRAVTTYLQLVRPGGLVDTSDPAPPGRTKVFEDDFSRSLSANRAGVDADYVVGKPEQTGVADFGEAPFADPSQGLHNVGQKDGYLKLSVQPGAEAAGRSLTGTVGHVGGMLASARPGGSGFSSQDGYFEARMLAPAAPGTWPAFWLLSNPSLVQTQPHVAEIDAVELYGHDPVSACHTSHQYPDPEKVGTALCGQRWGSSSDALSWHTYAVDVRPDQILYYIDGVLVGHAPQVAAGNEPMFFMLDLALGGGWPVDLSGLRGRASLYVDWVRVYV